MATWKPVIAADQVADKSFLCTLVDGVGVVICNLGQGRFHAIENRCSHARASFDEGRLRGPRILCPLHGAMFDVRTGEPRGEPAKLPIATYPVRVTNEGVIEVEVPELQDLPPSRRPVA